VRSTVEWNASDAARSETRIVTWSNTAPDYGTNAGSMPGYDEGLAATHAQGLTVFLARRRSPWRIRPAGATIKGVLAAAVTIWIMFSLWIISSCAGLPHPIGRIALVLLALELGSLMIWSYGSESCDERTCAPLAQAAGIAARTDVPILAGVFLLVTVVRLTRRLRAGTTS
jgi:hypothetical protein